MRIGILTHPLKSNYGGILQCYALVTYLRSLGYEPIVIQRQIDKPFILIRWIITLLKLLNISRYSHPNQIDRSINIRPFVDAHFICTVPIKSQRQMRKVCTQYELEAVIVGSDQVWRQDYAMKFGYNYFLDFVPEDVIKVSYAASFGLSDWKYTLEQTEKIKALLARFKGISVREDEAVSLCFDNLEVKAEHLLDPTMLLSAKQYDVITSPCKINGKYVFVYWLGDKSLITNDLVRYRNDGYNIIDINLRDNVEQFSIEDWLSYIKYANIVITDSFHGCVFSIIFQRPFIIYSNDSGGNGRLKSLFKMLGIENKLVAPDSWIDYQEISDTIKAQQQKSENYLTRMLR